MLKRKKICRIKLFSLKISIRKIYHKDFNKIEFLIQIPSPLMESRIKLFHKIQEKTPKLLF